MSGWDFTNDADKWAADWPNCARSLTSPFLFIDAAPSQNPCSERASGVYSASAIARSIARTRTPRVRGQINSWRSKKKGPATLSTGAKNLGGFHESRADRSRRSALVQRAEHYIAKAPSRGANAPMARPTGPPASDIPQRIAVQQLRTVRCEWRLSVRKPSKAGRWSCAICGHSFRRHRE